MSDNDNDDVDLKSSEELSPGMVKSMEALHKSCADIIAQFLDALAKEGIVPEKESIGFQFGGSVTINPVQAPSCAYKFMIQCQMDQVNKQHLN